MSLHRVRNNISQMSLHRVHNNVSQMSLHRVRNNISQKFSDYNFVALKLSISPNAYMLSEHYKVVCVHTSGEVDSFNICCSALIAEAICQI